MVYSDWQCDTNKMTSHASIHNAWSTKNYTNESIQKGTLKKSVLRKQKIK